MKAKTAGGKSVNARSLRTSSPRAFQRFPLADLATLPTFAWMKYVFDHTRIRVSDLDKSIQWYCDHCGFTVERRTDKSPSGNQLAHLSIPGSPHKLELTYSPDFEVTFPEDLIHTCIRVDDIMTYCAEREDAGVEVWPGKWKEKFAHSDKRMAFITDPDGYEVEILEIQ